MAILKSRHVSPPPQDPRGCVQNFHGNPGTPDVSASPMAPQPTDGVAPAREHSSPQNGFPTVVQVTFGCLRTIWTRLQCVFGILTDGTLRHGIPTHLHFPGRAWEESAWAWTAALSLEETCVPRGEPRVGFGQGGPGRKPFVFLWFSPAPRTGARKTFVSKHF